MKKIILSTVAMLSLANAGVNEIELLKVQMDDMAQKIKELENKKEAKSTTAITSKSIKINMSGKHYLGFISTTDDLSDETSNSFETRRNYFQIKAYFPENPKSYFRTTFDTTHKDDGDWNVRLKYAYLYLHNILPFTGVEIGQAHRPWIDYEEHGGWNYRSISKVFVEAHEGAHLTNSADLGINFKTKTEYFSSEVGVFNGEGYHGTEDGEGLSAEWRLTAHALGGGTHKSKKKNTYANISFLGQLNESSNKHKNQDLNWYGIHGVYNQPEFLISAQYISTDDADSKYAGEGYSVNAEARLGDFTGIARYDFFEIEDSSEEKTRAIAGVSYRYNKNVEFILSAINEKVEDDSTISMDETSILLSAEINW